VTIGIRQQSQEARVLYRSAELALVKRGGAGDARRNDFAILADEVLQDIDVLVINVFDAFRSEAAKLLALE